MNEQELRKRIAALQIPSCYDCRFQEHGCDFTAGKNLCKFQYSQADQILDLIRVAGWGNLNGDMEIQPKSSRIVKGKVVSRVVGKFEAEEIQSQLESCFRELMERDEQLEAAENQIENYKKEMEKSTNRIKQLEDALQADASDLWDVTHAIKKEIEAREWILEGRGCYAWDDDRYRDETRIVFESVLGLIKNIQHPAQLRFNQLKQEFLGGK